MFESIGRSFELVKTSWNVLMDDKKLLVFPVLSVAGIVIALAHVPWSVMIYLLAPLIMAYLFWHQTG